MKVNQIFKKKIKVNNGFTLLELMTVVLITGILVSLAAPGINSFFDSIVAQSKANSIISALNKARSTAISKNSSIIFMINDNGYWEYGCLNVNTNNNSGAYCPDAIMEKNSDSLITGQNTVSINFEPESNYLVFNSLGMVVDNGGGSPPLEKINVATDLKEYQILIKNSGQPKLCEGEC